MEMAHGIHNRLKENYYYSNSQRIHALTNLLKLNTILLPISALLPEKKSPCFAHRTSIPHLNGFAKLVAPDIPPFGVNNRDIIRSCIACKADIKSTEKP